MGKRTKKKVQGGISGRNANSLKVSSLSLSASTSSSLEGGCSVDASNGPGCTHGPNLEKLRSQLAKSNVLHCSGCSKLRSGVLSGKDRKRKPKLVRKKPASPSWLVDDKIGSHKLWICLSCGHVGCGHGNPKLLTSTAGEINKQAVKQGLVGRGHAWQHWLQLKHPAVMLCGENFSSWCFCCEEAHDVKHVRDVSSQFAGQSPAVGDQEASAPLSRAFLLHESEALVREKLSEESGVEKVESGQLTRRRENENGMQSCVDICVHDLSVGRPSRRVMKGLVNLGNTCFFNSVMQNLLSVEVLRRHFDSSSPALEGVLTASLRKFFRDASARFPEDIDGAVEAGIKKGARNRAGWSSIDGTYNPKGLLSAVCLKAPRFKGSQQQDSHELFKALLDILHGEEETSRKAFFSSGAGEEALRALSKSEETISLTQPGERDGALSEDTELEEESATELRQNPLQPETTFVERMFGGQLSSTVTCCECGHSSVKYESFLDLSLPIPPTRLPKKGSAPDLQTSGVGTRSQKVQALKNSKASNKTDPDLDIFRSVPAGLGTPLLLLPPPPPKEDKIAVTESASEDVWLDYLSPVTEPTGTDWLGFVDIGSSIRSAGSTEEASRPTPNSSPRFDSEAIQSSIATFDSDLRSSFISDTKTTPKNLNALPLSCNGNAPGDAVWYGAQLEQKSTLRNAASHAMGKGIAVDLSVDQILDVPYLATMSPSQGAPEVIGDGEDKNAERGLRPIFSQGGDVRVLMRGGSRTAGLGSESCLDSAKDSELDSFVAIAEQSNDEDACFEQFGTWNADAKLPSDIIDGPNGPIILLGGPAVDDSTGIAGSNVGSDGEFDGVDALFTEPEALDEGQMFGPALQSHNDESGLDESAYEDVIFHDVLDLSKISIDGKTDWLVCHDEKEGEDNDGGPISVESCLQTFTKSEMLSGENAWECDECAKRYQDVLAATGGILSSPTNEEETFNKPEMGELPERLASPDGQSDGPNTTGDVSNKVLSSSTPEKVEPCDVNVGSGNEPIGGEDSLHSHDTLTSRSPLSTGREEGAGLLPLQVEEKDVKIQQECFDNDSRVNCAHVRSVLEPLDLNKLDIREDPSGSGDAGHEVVPSSVMQVKEFAGGVDGKAVIDNLGVATSTSAQSFSSEKVADPLNSGKSSKPKKLRQQKLTGERKPVIKRDATKQFLISKAPLVLTIQLKRFAQDMRGRLSKLSGHVAFQEFLDLRPFLDHRSVTLDFKYRLVGAVEHTGTLKSGHYVAFVRGPPATETSALKPDEGSSSCGLSSWYHISDEQVRPTNLEAVLQREAYLVFYERVDVGDGFQ